MYEIVFEPSDLNMLAAIGIIEKAKLFPYLLSMGDLRHPCDSCYRCEQFIKCLSEYCTDCKSQAKKAMGKISYDRRYYSRRYDESKITAYMGKEHF